MCLMNITWKQLQSECEEVNGESILPHFNPFIFISSASSGFLFQDSEVFWWLH